MFLKLFFFLGVFAVDLVVWSFLVFAALYFVAVLIDGGFLTAGQ